MDISHRKRKVIGIEKRFMNSIKGERTNRTGSNFLGFGWETLGYSRIEVVNIVIGGKIGFL